MVKLLEKSLSLELYQVGFRAVLSLELISPVFPDDSDGKEFTCSVQDLGSVPGLEDPPEESMATHSSILTWRIPRDRGAWRATIHGVAKSQTQLRD